MFWRRRKRLYIALFMRDLPSRTASLQEGYHWALVIAPKDETPAKRGRIFHAKKFMHTDDTPGWRFEERNILPNDAKLPLVRVCVGKIRNLGKVESWLRRVPIRDEAVGWSCVSWVMEALEQVDHLERAMASKELDWGVVRNATMAYVQRKKEQHRFAWEGSFNMAKTPTFDILKDIETVP